MHEQHATQKRFAWEWLALCALLLLTLLLLTGHKTHVFSLLPYLLILACPLMHVFMLRNHGRNHDNSERHE